MVCIKNDHMNMVLQISWAFAFFFDFFQPGFSSRHEPEISKMATAGSLPKSFKSAFQNPLGDITDIM